MILKATLRQKAYRRIKDKIIFFELKPGERILESKIARTLKLGRMPVREALAMLESERLIVRANGYGYKVTTLKNAEVEDYLNIRISLESIGAALLIQRATDADILRMQKHIEKAVQVYLGGNTRKIIESDTRFHEMMYRATKSDVFFETISSLTDKTIIMRAAAMQTQKGRNMSIKDHLGIMAAIEARDLALLQELIHEHLKFAPQHYESIRPFLFT